MSVGKKSEEVPYLHERQFLDRGEWKTVSKSEGMMPKKTEIWDFPVRPKKPNPLLNTGGVLTRETRNTDRIVVKTSDTSRSIGTAYYVLSGPTTIVSSSSLDKVGGLSTLAKNRLNSVDLNVGVILGEGRETYSMLRNTAVRLTQAYMLLRKGNFEGVARTLGVTLTRRQKARVKDLLDERAYSRAWLSLQFGWMPLISDVHTAVTRDWKRLEKGSSVKGYARLKAEKDARGVTSSSAASGWTGTVKNPDLMWAQQLGVLNPLQLAWNLLPFSFVADWFFGINQILGGMTATAGINDLSAWYTYDRRTTYLKSGAIQWEYVIITRGVGVPPSSPVPTRFDFGGWHVATSLALLASVFKR